MLLRVPRPLVAVVALALSLAFAALPLAVLLAGCSGSLPTVEAVAGALCAALAPVRIGGVEVGRVCTGLESVVTSFLAARSSAPVLGATPAPRLEAVAIGGSVGWFVPPVAAELRKPEVKAALEADLRAAGLAK